MRTASTVAEFCEEHRISKGMLYKLWDDGKGPRRMKIGRKVLISAEAAAEWRKQLEEVDEDRAA